MLFEFPILFLQLIIQDLILELTIGDVPPLDLLNLPMIDPIFFMFDCVLK